MHFHISSFSGPTHKTKVWDLLHSACKAGNIDHLSVALKVSPLNPEGDYLLKLLVFCSDLKHTLRLDVIIHLSINSNDD